MNDKGLWGVALLIVGVASLTFYGRGLEGKWLPVSVGFELDAPATIDASGHLVVSGRFENVRDCKFNSIAFHYVSGKEAKGRGAFIRDDQPKNTSKSRGVGVHPFGPWVISVPERAQDAQMFYVFVDHDCHPLWTTRTKLTSLPMAKIRKVKSSQ